MGRSERASCIRRFKLNYFQPALKTSNTYFNERPIFTTFLAIFFTLATLPVLAFLGITLFAIVSFTFIALVVTFIASSAVILGLSTILASILLAALLASGLFTFVAIFAYFLFRLFVLVRKDGVSGVSGWACETKSHILKFTNRHNSAYGHNTLAQDDLSDTNESVAVVHEPEAHSSDYHDENDDTIKVQG